ncbi:uroporphyrinogen-III synthase [Aliiroseovarius halocynthiae]|uniref:Uroporphyrinogen-III synthase n=2 Tax=Aliiroseovarius halocynthiae TaxID=985055 RepID=A0A545SNH9_9RHOB|nr:uroporphyrinogen-III synthase [Aliiroseovarius halocynthiae]TQV66542.1 uroporphyrinogen-III synthase [Aliiroseovarius halocynthiae]SMR82590.1 uroporphyrinogen-III synthase [Aliiroseovarius halocynthiae]
MHQTPILVLTRPQPAALRVLQQVEQALGQPVASVISPVLQIVEAGDWPAIPDGTDVILTSEHAVRGDLSGIHVHCVGTRTAEAAAAKGANVITTGVDAEDLIKALTDCPRGKGFLHICGSHKAVDIAARLSDMGYNCDEHQTYSQVARPLSDQARAALEGEDPALLPLFSPRSARLIGRALTSPGSQLSVLAMSDAIADQWQTFAGTPCKAVEQPTGHAMVRGIVAALRGYAA